MVSWQFNLGSCHSIGLTLSFLGGIDLASDYTDFAQSIKELAYLESGITDPLNKFADRMIEFASVLKHVVSPPCFLKCLGETDGRSRVYVWG